MEYRACYNDILRILPHSLCLLAAWVPIALAVPVAKQKAQRLGVLG
jgi:hypothetical protein